jgi:2-aminoethylphosphonate-pyruvate transaminase
MKVVILAAGAGSSLYPLTRDRPKSLLAVNGVPLLERLLLQSAAAGLTPVVVVGYEKDKILQLIRRLQPALPTRVEVVENPRYDRTNTLSSLWLARHRCAETAFMVVDGDLICDDAIFTSVVRDPRDTVLAIDRSRVMGDEEVKVVCDADGRVLEIGKALPAGQAHGEFIGMAKFSAATGETLLAIADQIARDGNEAAYYEDAIARLTGYAAMEAIDVAGQRWVEIDFLADYVEALRQFGDAERADAVAALPSIRPQLLFCPGPVLVSERVKAAFMVPEIGHREVEFSEMLNRVRRKVGKVFGIRNFHRYTTVVLNGGGSAANEALLGTAALGRRLLVLSNGEFGERLVQIATHLGIDVQPFTARWGQPFDLGAVEWTIAQGGFDVVAWVHHETSTGMLNPLAEIADLAHRHGLETYVDAVSSLGGVPVDVEDNGLTFCTSSANKAIGSVPGLAFVCGRRDAFEALAPARAHSPYLDLYRHFSYNDRLYQTPNTPAVTLYFALEAALDELLDEGLEARYARVRGLAQRLRAGFARLGLRALLPEPLMSPCLTTLELPAGFSSSEFLDRLKRAGYIVYAGKGILKDRAFQVANIGALTVRHVDGFLGALQNIIEDPRDHTSSDPGGRTRIPAAAAH